MPQTQHSLFKQRGQVPLDQRSLRALMKGPFPFEGRYTCTHAHTCVYTHAWTYTCTHGHTCTRVHARPCTCTHMYTYTLTHAHMRTTNNTASRPSNRKHLSDLGLNSHACPAIRFSPHSPGIHHWSSSTVKSSSLPSSPTSRSRRGMCHAEGSGVPYLCSTQEPSYPYARILYVSAAKFLVVLCCL